MCDILGLVPMMMQTHNYLVLVAWRRQRAPSPRRPCRPACRAMAHELLPVHTEQTAPASESEYDLRADAG